MKKIILISAMALLCLEMYAQTDKGSVFLGGQVFFANNKTDASNNMSTYTSKSFNFQVFPGLGLLIKDNLAIGVSLNIGSFTNKTIYDAVDPAVYTTTNSTTMMTYGVGVFLRSYSRIADKFYFSFNGLLSYTSQPGNMKSMTEDPNYVYPPASPATQYTRSSTVGIGITPGVDYFISPAFGLRATFGNLYFNSSNYKNITLQNDNNQTVTSFGLNLNINSFTFGMNYFF